MAGRIIFQMDKAKPENKIVCGHQQECGHDTDLDRAVCLFASGFPQVPVEVAEKHATNLTIITTQSV